MRLFRGVLVVLLGAAAGVVVPALVHADEAWANLGKSIMHPEEWTLRPAPGVYGQEWVLVGFVEDDSGSCELGDCNTPSGDVFFSIDNFATFFASVPLRAGPNLDQNFSTFEAHFTNLPPTVTRLYARYHAPSNIPSVGFWPFEDSSTSIAVQIVKANVGVTLGEGTPDPSSFGQAVSFSVSVASNPAAAANAAKPSGRVVLTYPGQTVANGEAMLDANGNATITSSNLAVGVYDHLTVAYLGDGNYNSAGSNVTTQTVNQATSSMSVTAGPEPSAYGSTTSLTATVTPNSASGTVQFYDGDSLIGDASLSAGVATLHTTELGVGSHTINAFYRGDTNFIGTDASTGHTVIRAASHTTLGSSPNPSVFGQEVALTAPVEPSGATGTVTFFDSGAPLGTAAAEGGDANAATFKTSSLAVGSHPLSASYGGNGNYNESATTTPYAHVVNRANTTSTLAPASATIDFGSSARLTMNVGAAAPGAGTPTGSATLSEGGTALAFATLSGGSASFDVPNLLPGVHTLVATYGGDGNFNDGTSNAASVSVTCQRSVSQPVSGNISVGSGSTCVSTPSIGGNVTISPGARVFFDQTQIGGSVFAAPTLFSKTAGTAANIVMCGSQVNGQVLISATTSQVMLGDGRSCAGNTVYGPISIDGTRGGVIVADNAVGGALSLTNNRPTTTVSNNRATGTLSCSGNSAAPTNAGRPNTALGKSGQCAGL
jgi:hypothetical protein